MSEYTDQRDAIVAAVEGVTGIGRVHDRLRYGDAYEHWVVGPGTGRMEGDFEVPQVNAWEVSLDDEGTKTDRISQGFRHRWRSWLVRGWVGLNDSDTEADGVGPPASYHTAADLALLVADAIDADPTLAGTALWLHSPGDGQDAPDISDPRPLQIGGGVLAWAVEVRFTAYTVVTG